MARANSRAVSLFQRACGLQAAGRNAEAVALYERALALDDEFAEAHNNLGTLLQNLGELDRALAHYDRALQLAPGAAALYDNRGTVLQKRGAFAEAIALHERAISLDPNLAQAYHNLGNAFLVTHRPNEALAPLQRALTLRPNFKDALNCLGAAQQALGLIDDAIASYRKAIEIAPDYAAAYCNLGNALREDGRLAEARAAYEKAVELEPRNGTFQRALVEVGLGPVDEKHFAQLSQLARGIETLDIGNRIPLHFALARVFADRNDFAQSFEHLQRGNSLARSTLSYDEAETLRSFDALPQMFTQGLIQAMSGAGDQSGAPIFIVGMPRSGTTLVEQVLAGHPRVHAAGELGVFMQNGEELGVFEKELRSFSAIDAHPSDVGKFLTLLGEELRKLGSRYARQVESLAPWAARVTDKWPWNFKFAGIIHLALPNARLIHVQRDPLDTCFSCYATLFSGNLPYTYDLEELGRYYRAYERLIGHWREALPTGAMLEVKYEDFVCDFEAQARRVVEFCGLDWDPACAEFSSVKRPVRTTSAVAVRQPLYRSAIGRAQAYLPYLGALKAALER